MFLEKRIFGKRFGRSSTVNTITGLSKLFRVHDKSTGVHYLVDTGAEISLIPPTSRERKLLPIGEPLRAANGTEIASYGSRNITIRLGNRSLAWKFTIAQVNQPILGADFLCHHKFLVDVHRRRLIHAETFETVRTTDAPPGTPQVHVIKSPINDEFEELLDEHPDLYRPKFSAEIPKHGVQHYISTQGPPVYARARRLPPEKLSIAKKEFDEMEALGIIRKSNSPWSSPLHMTPKPDGTWRPCGDYRRLNTATVDDRYPVPRLQDFTAKLAGKTIFSKIDLVRGYHQVPVAENDIQKTAVVTPFGLYEFLRMPFGLKNAAQAFQRLMDTVCNGLSCIFVYLDDILVASENPKQHRQDLISLFQRLATHGLVVNRAKCIFGVSSINFLGHHVSINGILPLSAKVDAVRAFPRPESLKNLQEFLGMINFYNRFIPHVAEILVPLHNALAESSHTGKLIWSTTMDTAFLDAKNALADATLLIHPVEGAPTSLTVDASNVAIGGVLEQYSNGLWRPLGFFSRKLNTRETKYSTFDRELLAAHLAIRHFRYFLEGRLFNLFTDQNALLSAMRKTKDPWTSRQQNQLSAISEYTTDIRFIAGKKNYVADALSRITINEIAVETGVDFKVMAEAQTKDEEIQQYVNNNSTSLQLKHVKLDDFTTLICDLSTTVMRPLVPKNFRKQVFEIIHGLAHPGVKTTRRMLTEKFVWPRISSDASRWARECTTCQQSKVHQHTRAPISDFRVASRRFEHIHVDIVGPLPVSQGYTHLLTIIDRYSRWPEAIPVVDTSAISLARALLHVWIARFGIPARITSDRGSQFTSTIWSQLSKLLGVELHRTTAYHPQANGLVERFHRDLKASLRARLEGPNWMDELPWVLLGLRTAPKEDLHASVAELIYGSPLTVPGDFVADSDDAVANAEFLNNLREEVAALRPTPTSRHGDTRCKVPENLYDAQYVFVRHDAHRSPLRRVYDGPFHVLERNEKYFILDMGGKKDSVSIDRLKKAHCDPTQPTILALPPRRGRPPTTQKNK